MSKKKKYELTIIFGRTITNGIVKIFVWQAVLGIVFSKLFGNGPLPDKKIVTQRLEEKHRCHGA